MSYSPKLEVESYSFQHNGIIPKKHTGFGEDISPQFHLKNICNEAVSIAIIMDDLDIPFIKAYNHWIIFNIPKINLIPENITCGEIVPELGNAIQGIGYGKNRYRGPKQPVFVRNTHRYVFYVYVLDEFLKLTSTARKMDLLAAMEGHILQQGYIVGKYKR